MEIIKIIQNIQRMNRKHSHSIKLKDRNYSLNVARKIYSSNKILKEKDPNMLDKKCSHESINKKSQFSPYIRPKVLTANDRKSCQKLPNSRQKGTPQLPNLKFTQSESSTTEDLMQKIQTKLNMGKQNKCFITVEGSRHINPRQRIPTVSYENTSNNQKSKRKVFQCKIIRSSKIPFPFPINAERKRRFSSLIADTEDISEIKIYPAANFISPDSQFLIDF